MKSVDFMNCPILSDRKCIKEDCRYFSRILAVCKYYPWTGKNEEEESERMLHDLVQRYGR